MSYEEAIATQITGRTAFNELKGHGFLPSEFYLNSDGDIVSRADESVVAFKGTGGLYSGRAVLNWLGY